MSAAERTPMDWGDVAEAVRQSHARQQQVLIRNIVGEQLTGSSFLDPATGGVHLAGQHRNGPFVSFMTFMPGEIFSMSTSETALVVPEYHRVDESGYLLAAEVSLLTPVPEDTTVFVLPEKVQ